MSRPSTIVCEDCGDETEQPHIGGPRRFCEDCSAARQRDRVKAWRAANLEAHRRHNRESARRRRRDGRLT